MPPQSSTDAASILRLSPAERESRAVTPSDVRDALQNVIEDGSSETKQFSDCTFPALDLNHLVLGGTNSHPVVFRDCEFGGEFDASHAVWKVPVRFENCTFDGLTLDGAHFEEDLSLEASRVRTTVDGFEARFDEDVDCTDTTFEGDVDLDEAHFGEDTRFDDASFRGEASFRGASFSGRSNELEDNVSFRDAQFEAVATFRQTSFGFATFRNATFQSQATFQQCHVDGDAAFDGVTFAGETDFQEAVIEDDVSFEAALFQAPVAFRGAAFRGGQSALQDDVRFENATFQASANFRDGVFGDVNFDDTTFDARALFEEATFDGDAEFTLVRFGGETDFDEARFLEDTTFDESRFKGPAVFRGAEFQGAANHLEENASFKGVQFEADADFDNAEFTSATFAHTRFGGDIDFSGVKITEGLSFLAQSVPEDTRIDFTNASICVGTITQPIGTRIPYDFTDASIGDVVFDAADEMGDEILDSVRFCRTQFDEFDGHEFDFGRYTEILGRTNWALHRFAGEQLAGVDVELTPATIEETYLKAKNAASTAGFIRAAGEFRIKRQKYARKKQFALARDGGVDAPTRLKAASRGVENLFLGVTCGHGMRLGRILVVFIVTPLAPALLYAFGGSAFATSAGQLTLSELSTPEGQAIFYEVLYFSYITYLTIGYGGIGPEGALARLLAASEVYVSIILGGLVLYALIKRSEV